MSGELIVKWLLVALLVLGALSKIALVGERRTPYTRGEAVFSVIWNGALVWAILAYL